MFATKEQSSAERLEPLALIVHCQLAAPMVAVQSGVQVGAQVGRGTAEYPALQIPCM